MEDSWYNKDIPDLKSLLTLEGVTNWIFTIRGSQVNLCSESFSYSVFTLYFGCKSPQLWKWQACLDQDQPVPYNQKMSIMKTKKGNLYFNTIEKMLNGDQPAVKCKSKHLFLIFWQDSPEISLKYHHHIHFHCRWPIKRRIKNNTPIWKNHSKFI